jgi:PAS domain S-box-containing protein
MASALLSRQNLSNSAASYALAIASAAVALGVRELLDPFLGDHIPYVPLLAGVAFSAWYFGSGPAIVTCLLTLLGAQYWFVQPRHSLTILNTAEAVGLMVYLAFSAVLIGIAESSRRVTANLQTSVRELREARHLFQIFMDNSPAAAYMKDEQGKYVYYNRTVEKRFNFGKAMLGKADADLFPVEVAAQYRGNDVAVLRSGKPLEFIEMSRDGAVQRSWLSIKFPMVDGEGKRFVGGTSLDITDRVLAEEELRRIHQELEERVKERTAELEREATQVVEQARLLDLANDAVFALRECKITYWNSGAERLYGWSRQEAIGQTPRELLHTEYPKPLSQITDLLSCDGHWEGDLLQTKRDGTCIAVVSRWSVWRGPEGTPQGWLEIDTDISERKRAEQELRELSVRLLQAQDEERRRLARELHDSSGQTLVALKSNLNTICNGATVLSPEAAIATSQSTALIDGLSKELRTMSYLLHPPLLDEVGLTSALRCYVEGLAERSSLKATLEISSDIGRLARDLEIVIFRIVQESLTNIHRHSGSPTARIRIARSPDEVQVVVEDEGKGLPPEKQANFESGVMTGVGLMGMRERVRQLGGQLEISSHAKGTAVIARLPLSSLSGCVGFNRRVYRKQAC